MQYTVAQIRHENENTWKHIKPMWILKIGNIPVHSLCDSSRPIRFGRVCVQILKKKNGRLRCEKLWKMVWFLLLFFFLYFYLITHLSLMMYFRMSVLTMFAVYYKWVKKMCLWPALTRARRSQSYMHAFKKHMQPARLNGNRSTMINCRCKKKI